MGANTSGGEALNGLAGTIYTPEMFSELGYQQDTIEQIVALAQDEDFPLEVRVTAVKLYALRSQLSSQIVDVMQDNSFPDLLKKYNNIINVING